MIVESHYKILALIVVIVLFCVGVHSASQSTLGNLNVSGNMTVDENVDITGNIYGSGANLHSVNASGGSSNSSEYWDNLDTPSDINAADITDDNTYVVTSTDTMTGNLTVEEIHIENDPTNHRIYDNTTCTIITGDTSTLVIC